MLTLNDAFTKIDNNSCTIIGDVAICAFRAQATTYIPNASTIATLPSGYVARRGTSFGYDVSTSQWLGTGNRRAFGFTTQDRANISSDPIAANEWAHFYQVIPVKKV